MAGLDDYLGIGEAAPAPATSSAADAFLGIEPERKNHNLAGTPTVSLEGPSPTARPYGGSPRSVSAGTPLGVIRGLRDPIDAAAQIAARTMETFAPSGPMADWAKAQREEVERVNAEAERDYQQNWRQGATGVDPARLGGNMIATAPLAAATGPTVGAGALMGAASGALQPVQAPEDNSSFWIEKAKQAALGGAAGAGGAAIAKGVGAAIAPREEVRRLVDAGVSPTPGQMLGGAAQRIEEGATSIPILGDVVKSAQGRALDSFNRAAVNEALAPIGEKLPASTPAGREAITEMGKRISSAYDEIVPQLTAKADATFANDAQSLLGLARNLPGDRAAQFERIMRDEVFKRFNPETAMMTGESLKAAESALGRLSATYRGSVVGDEQLLGDAVRELQSSLRSLVERSNPAAAEQLGNINRAYAMQLRLENAAARLGSKEGVFTPNALDAAARQLDTSLRHRSFARGDALMQDLAEAGQKVIGSKVPDSGTAFRAMTAGGLPLAAGYLANPAAGAGVGAAMLPYTPLGQKMLALALGSRPDAAIPLGKAVSSAAPIAGAGAGAGLIRLLSGGSP